jgi:diacylglycerol O-acyltransferase / wax synthase
VQTVGSDRSLALIPASLDQAKQTAHAQNATVNDVLLAVTAGGPRELLRSRGELADGLTVRIEVPVTLRPAQDRDKARGNLIASSSSRSPSGWPTQAGGLRRSSPRPPPARRKATPRSVQC